MATTTVPALIGALKTQLQASSDLDGVLVSWGIPTEPPGPEWLLLGDAIGTQAQAAIARTRYPREEEYRVQVTISVLRDFGQQQDATTRACAIAAVLDGILRADPTVGGVVREALIDGQFNVTQHQDLDTGKVCEGRVLVEVRVKSRLNP